MCTNEGALSCPRPIQEDSDDLIQSLPVASAMERALFDAAVQPGRLRIAAVEVAAQHWRERFVFQRRAAQVNRHPPAGVIGGLNIDAKVVLPFAIALRL